MEINDTDKKTLEILMQNGRLRIRIDIGKELNLSRNVVRDRVQQLMEKGVIEKISAVVNAEAVGKKVSAFFEVDCEPADLVKVAEKLAKNPNVASCYRT